MAAEALKNDQDGVGGGSETSRLTSAKEQASIQGLEAGSSEASTMTYGWPIFCGKEGKLRLFFASRKMPQTCLTPLEARERQTERRLNVCR